MTQNTSATGGYLSPLVVSPPQEDTDLDLLFQGAIAGISGLAGNLVRPRWQPTIPVVPEANINWCALSVTVEESQDFPYIEHVGAGNGSDTFIRHEDIELFCTFYGPNAQQKAALLRDGFYIPQNLEALNLAGIGFVEADSIRAAPELFNQQWVKRYDLTLRFRRKVQRTYPVLNILSATPEIISDDIGII